MLTLINQAKYDIALGFDWVFQQSTLGHSELNIPSVLRILKFVMRELGFIYFILHTCTCIWVLVTQTR